MLAENGSREEYSVLWVRKEGKENLEVWLEAAFSLVTFASLGTEAAHHHHNNCRGDGSLSESRTPCHCSGTCPTDKIKHCPHTFYFVTSLSCAKTKRNGKHQ